MTDPSETKPRIPEALRQRAAERATNGVHDAVPAQPKTSGPAPSRILAAAASVATGVGLVALMAGNAGGQEIVVQVQPAPVIVQPVAVEDRPPAAPEVRVVGAAAPVEPSSSMPAPVAESEGS